MPQLDKVTFLSQFFWLCIFFGGFYIFQLKFFLPKMSRILKFRKKKMNESREIVDGEQNSGIENAFKETSSPDTPSSVTGTDGAGNLKAGKVHQTVVKDLFKNGQTLALSSAFTKEAWYSEKSKIFDEKVNLNNSFYFKSVTLSSLTHLFAIKKSLLHWIFWGFTPSVPQAYGVRKRNPSICGFAAKQTPSSRLGSNRSSKLSLSQDLSEAQVNSCGITVKGKGKGKASKSEAELGNDKGDGKNKSKSKILSGEAVLGKSKGKSKGASVAALTGDDLPSFEKKQSKGKSKAKGVTSPCVVPVKPGKGKGKSKGEKSTPLPFGKGFATLSFSKTNQNVPQSTDVKAAPYTDINLQRNRSLSYAAKPQEASPRKRYDSFSTQTFLSRLLSTVLSTGSSLK